VYVPQQPAGVRVERDQVTVVRAAEDLAGQIGGPPIVGAYRPLSDGDHKAPVQVTGRRVESDCQVGGVDVQRPAHLQQPGAEHGRLVEPDFTDLFELADVLRRDLVEIDIALAGVILVDRDPVVGP